MFWVPHFISDYMALSHMSTSLRYLVKLRYLTYLVITPHISYYLGILYYFILYPAVSHYIIIFFYTVFSCSVLHYSVVSYDILLPPTLPYLIMSHYLLYYPILYHLYYIILPSTYHAVYRPVLILYFLLILSRAARSL
jgi:hypothetical protein